MYLVCIEVLALLGVFQYRPFAALDKKTFKKKNEKREKRLSFGPKTTCQHGGGDDVLRPLENGLSTTGKPPHPAPLGPSPPLHPQTTCNESE